LRASPATGGQRIAIVADAVYPYHIGGKERAIYEIGKRLAARGYVVDVYTMKWWNGSQTASHEGMTYHAIMPLVPLYTKDRRRSIQEAVRFALATLKVGLRRFDVLHVDGIPFIPLISGRIVATLRRKRLTTTWYEFWGRDYWRSYVSEPQGSIGAWLERTVTHCPDLIISISQMTADRITPIVGKERVATVPLGVDIAKVDAVQASPEVVDVLFSGRFLHNKGVDLLIEAVDKLKAARPDIRCVIVGSGPERENLLELIASRGLESNVSIRPFVDDEADLFALMKAARVFALPSVREGFGLVALEAIACGTPVVTTNHDDNAARDLIVTGQNGLLCTPDDSDIAAKIEQILDSPAFSDRDAIRATAAGFDWDAVAASYEELLLRTPTPKDTARSGATG
jgi:glycosyltransferase involved in cell wall biosynthesis